MRNYNAISIVCCILCMVLGSSVVAADSPAQTEKVDKNPIQIFSLYAGQKEP